MSALSVRLISIVPSHFCEKARWALDRAGISYTEDKHVPAFHIFYTRNLGGRSCPKLIIGGSTDPVILKESNDILLYADKSTSEEHGLYPVEETLRKNVEDWTIKFDQKLAPNVRQWGYHYILYHKGSYRMLTDGAPLWERIFAWLTMPLLRSLLYNSMNLGKPGGKDISLKKITEVFQEVDSALSDGRPFICGDNFTAADLTFAALAGPVLNPEGYGCWYPPIEEIPKEMAEVQRNLRETTAGKHVLKLYRSYRSRMFQKEL